MHPYFKRRVEVNNARCDFKRTIERIANECNIDINIKIYTDSPVITVWDKSVTAVISAAGVATNPDVQLGKSWSMFLTNLEKELKNQKEKK